MDNFLRERAEQDVATMSDSQVLDELSKRNAYVSDSSFIREALVNIIEYEYQTEIEEFRRSEQGRYMMSLLEVL